MLYTVSSCGLYITDNYTSCWVEGFHILLQETIELDKHKIVVQSSAHVTVTLGIIDKHQRFGRVYVV